MKKVIYGVIALLMLSFMPVNKGLNNADKELVVTEMTKTTKYLLQAIKGLSPEQLNFKSSPESWSVAECVEHIAVSESNIFGAVEAAVKTPADASKRDLVKITDDEVIGFMLDRTKKAKAPEAFKPSGKFGSHKETVKAFLKKRKQNIKYAKKTEDNLRNHYGEMPFGVVDGVQLMVFISAHSERHILQIKEIMSHTDFPNK
ncbi:DinB family protein [Cellulophaga sp. 20_2_10]|uniref:DinB family protein n=1 Tax=Cellulophaga sp. 20_2_10 TaxID=2942476 RepID=UPI00201AB4E7|nr:DinB family protein [Cellulophaga sp. 20_2_10]MCL5246337.1 DinB family protein [Cellulophaga sp. 20_2_10]